MKDLALCGCLTAQPLGSYIPPSTLLQTGSQLGPSWKTKVLRVTAKLGTKFAAHHGRDDECRPLPAARTKDGHIGANVGNSTEAPPGLVVLVVLAVLVIVAVASQRKKTGTKNGSACFISCATFEQKLEPASLKDSKIQIWRNGAKHRDIKPSVSRRKEFRKNMLPCSIAWDLPGIIDRHSTILWYICWRNSKRSVATAACHKITLLSSKRTNCCLGGGATRRDDSTIFLSMANVRK